MLNGEDETNRAISIYNKETNTDKGPDYPFLSISRINNRSAATNGRFERVDVNTGNLMPGAHPQPMR